jgi:hypothetical protein
MPLVGAGVTAQVGTLSQVEASLHCPLPSAFASQITSLLEKPASHVARQVEPIAPAWQPAVAAQKVGISEQPETSPAV